jgi:cbb3-type cytochrome oxidase subunit 3
MKTIKELNEKLWYRAIKVLTLIFFCIVSIIILYWAYSERPIAKTDWEKTSIVCANGNMYNPEKNSISVYYGEKDQDIRNDSWRDAKIKKLCAYDIIANNPLDESVYKIPVDNNYAIARQYKVVGSWEKVINIIFWGALVSYLVFQLVLKSFYYIVLGTLNPPKDDY